MQKGMRLNESQLAYLAQKAKHENSLCGYLYKKSADTGKWQLRWFAVFQNLLFYYDNESASRASGVCLLEGCYCERIVTPLKSKDGEKQHCFAILFRTEGQRQYDLRVDTEAECDAWMETIRQASYCKNLELKEQLEQKHMHLLHILDSERQAKWHYVQQTEELTMEVKKLKNELREYKKERKISNDKVEEENEEIRKIKKVQSFFRGWLCRRRWKQIVDEYIRSDHAESMRKRNSIVFGMVECEEEYVKQLSTLVSVFLRPFRMAASSKKPPITHEDVNSIFLNSETLLFLHQIFLKGLMARMENWPTLVLARRGDLFDMLLPMLGIYQEYVRNHHYSLQVLAEYKQKSEFNELLRRYEEKPVCEGRTLELFLTYPMHQIPRYIITIHELLAHTPHDHVERKSLEFAQSNLEELSQIMQDEVSETENIRKNLAIERMIVEGCDILLDVNQTFVRQGSLLQVIPEKQKGGRTRLGSFSTTFSPRESKKDCVRQVFLFTNHMLLTTRASNGRLHLAKHNGKIPLIDCTLIEDSNSDIFYFDDDAASVDSNISSLSGASHFLAPHLSGEKDKHSTDYNGLDFRVIVDYKSGPPANITLVASSLQEKAAWCSDISQCIENLHYSDLINSSMTDISSVTMPQSVRSDPKLFRDDIDIKFSRTLNSCKVPQIRHASVTKLLERLTDLRFLSIDFLNTFLLTYRVFTTGQTVLTALKRVYKNPEYGNLDTCNALLSVNSENSEDAHHRYSIDAEMLFEHDESPPEQLEFRANPPSNGCNLIKPQVEKPRRTSTGCMPIEVAGARSPMTGRVAFRAYEKSGTDTVEIKDNESSEKPSGNFLAPAKPKLAPIASCETLSDYEVQEQSDSTEVQEESSDSSDESYVTTAAITVTTNTNLTVARSAPPTTYITLSHNSEESSSDNLDASQNCGNTLTVPISSGLSTDTLSSNNGHSILSGATSSDTLVPTSPCFSPIVSPIASPKRGSSPLSPLTSKFAFRFKGKSAPPIKIPSSHQFDALALSPATSPKFKRPIQPIRRATSPSCVITGATGRMGSPSFVRPVPCSPVHSPVESPKMKRVPSPLNYSISSPNIITNFKARTGKRGSEQSDYTSSSYSSTTPRSSFATSECTSPSAKAGTVVTSSRASKRRSSSTAATAAFAKATAGSTNPKDHPKGINRFHSQGAGEHKPGSNQSLNKKRESVISTAASMRVLNVLRHWVSKHSQDFESDTELKAVVKDLIEEMVCNATLCQSEHRAATSILHVLTNEEETVKNKVDLAVLLTPPSTPTKDSFDTLSALDIAEQLTYLDHQIFMAIRSEELLSQAWMKPNKASRAPHVLLVSKRFNEVSRLVVSEIVRRQNLQDRVACIEKWAAIADICRCMHNFNGVLQICAAFVNASVYRLKKTWEKTAKQSKQMMEKLQTLVSSDSRFKNMRDALHRCDPPCIPYLGMYLTDLSFIEEGTPNVTEEGLVNFSKMRMIAHVIREIQHFQQTSYRIEHHKRVTNYLLDPSRLLDDDVTYKNSLEMEPRTARVSVPSGQSSC